jgi:hypothetical protein
MLEEIGRGSPDGRTKRRPIHCEECTIQIGDGYQETIPFEFVDDESAPRPKAMKVCWRCWESLNRRKAKRLGHSDGSSPGLIS